MKTIRIEKVTLNMCAGKDQILLEKGMKLLKNISNQTPIKTITQKRIATWGLRPGLPIGCKVTIRKKKAVDILKRIMYAKNNEISSNQIDENGNFSFGIPEYIDIQGVKYDLDIGIIGLEACVTLERAGYRIKSRSIKKRMPPPRHRITKEEAIEFLKKEFSIKIGEKNDV